MDPSAYADPGIVLVTADPDLLDQALSIMAAAGVEATVFSDPGLLRAAWSSAAMVLIGGDQGPAVAALQLARRTEVYLLTEVEASADAFRWSVALGAAVVVLPEGASWLSRAVTDLAGRPSGSGRVIALIGGSGGVGVSTLAAGLAFTAARQVRRSLLVDADRLGGGLDLLIGAERVSGWRWSRLAGARGQLGDLAGQLPQLDGVEVLAMDRGGGSSNWEPGADEVRAVLSSAAYGYPVTVVDLPRIVGPVLTETASRADLLLRGGPRGCSGAGVRAAVAGDDRPGAGSMRSRGPAEPGSADERPDRGRSARAAAARHAGRRAAAGRGRRTR